MSENILAFGDLHANWQNAKIILDVAIRRGIKHVLTLGDEVQLPRGPAAATSHDPNNEIIIFDEYRRYLNGASNRELTALVGNNVPNIPIDLRKKFMGVSPDDGRQTATSLYQQGNVIAGHVGEWITNNYGKLIKDYDGDDPLIIFLGHSHSMGVLDEDTRIPKDELVHSIPEGRRVYNLEKGKAHYVNPGGNFYVNEAGLSCANFATYDRGRQQVILETILFDRLSVKPTREL